MRNHTKSINDNTHESAHNIPLKDMIANCIIVERKNNNKMETTIKNLVKSFYRVIYRHFLKQKFIFLLLHLAAIPATLLSQNEPPEFVKNTVRNVERMLDSDGEEAILKFIEMSMTNQKDQNVSSLVDKIKHIRKEMRGLRDNIMVEGEEGGVRLVMSNGQEEKQLKILLDHQSQSISDLILLDSPQPLDLTVENISDTFDQLERDGISGVIYIKIDGEVVFKRAFGWANKELGIKNSFNTIFGTGSRPIDYTIAAIHLLSQQKLLNLKDKIGKYLIDVPDDKQSITILHLLQGQSGLPDFFHTDEDWDPDLAWVSRETAIARLLSMDLLFEPGTDRSHSHGAFGMLAAIIEIVSGQPYYSFINEHFFSPAGMLRTGEYGDKKDFTVSDFAVGCGPQRIGLPNIPPNWGPTSWLVKGSGGMYSTLEDLLKFYDYIRSGKVLDEEHSSIFRQSNIHLDGSDRGFELFSAYKPQNNEIFLLLNEVGNRDKFRQIFRALERLIEIR